MENLIKNLIAKLKDNNHSNLKDKLLYGTFWNLIGTVASQGFIFIAGIITARLLGTVGYGQFGIINSTILMFSTFTGLGLGITATKFISQHHEKDKARTGRIIGLTAIVGTSSGLLMFLILFLIAPLITLTLFNAPYLTLDLRIAALLLIFNTLAGVPYGTITGFGSFKIIARNSIIQGIISFPITIAGVYFFGLTGLISSMVLTSVLNLFLYGHSMRYILSKYKIKIDYSNAFKEKNILWNFSVPSMLSTIVVGPIIWLAYTIIVNTPNGYAQLGIFSAVEQWKNVALFLPLVMGTVLLQMVSSNVSKKNDTLETINVLAGWAIVTAIALPIITFPEIIGLLYGSGYSSTFFFQSLIIIVFTSCIIAYKDGIARNLIAKDLMWLGFSNNLFWGILFIVMVLLLKNLGAVGLALSFLTSYAVTALVFIPLFLSKGVVPKNLLISKETILIWFILIIQTIISLLNFSLIIRLITLIISFGILFFSFYRIWDPVSKNYQINKNL